MDFRAPVTLGRSGLRVGRLGIAAAYGVPAHAVEAAYHEYGTNLLYWGSARRGGMRDAIRNLARTQREKLVIALQTYDRTGWFMRPRLVAGLRRLRIEYADLLILGWFNEVPRPRILDAALALQQKGLVRHLMISGHHRPAFVEFAKPGSPFDVLMVRYNAAHPGAEQDVFPHLPATDGPGVVTYTNTSWGTLLSPKWAPPGEPPLRASDCYRFALSNPGVTACFTGPADAEQMREALHALEAGPLSAEEMARVRRVGAHVRAREKTHWRRLMAGE